MFLRQEISSELGQYIIRAKADTEFSAKIEMNPRDAMISAVVTKASNAEQVEEFKKYLRDQVGGKILLSVPAEMKVTGEKVDHCNFVSRATLETKMGILRKKEKVTKALDKKSSSEELDEKAGQSLKLLQEPKEYEGLHEKLFRFKKANASFVTQPKIDAGQYSAIAEQKKVTNPNVKHFAFYDTKTEEFIATLQACVQGDVIYLSDFIVGEKHRGAGIAQLIMLKAYEEMIEKGAKKMAGAWFIAGGDGANAIGKHLYGDVLASENLTKELQEKLGLVALFGPPKELLLLAANRSLLDPARSLDGVPSRKSSHSSMYKSAETTTAPATVQTEKSRNTLGK